MEIEKNILKVDQSTCKTSKDRIYAIGDICTILENLNNDWFLVAIAALDCYNTVHPEKVLHFEYSTTKGINKI